MAELQPNEEPPPPQPSITTTESQKEKTFDFFGLPPELRDLVYDELVFRRYACPGAYWRYDFTTVTPFPEARLVSQQFKTEYDKRWKPKVSVTIRDIPICLESSHDSLELAVRTPYILTAKIRLDVPFCTHIYRYSKHQPNDCDTEEYMAQHQICIPLVLMSLPNLQTVSIEVHIKGDEWEPDCFGLTIEEMDILCDVVPELTKLEVYTCEDYCGWHGGEDDNEPCERALLARWTAATAIYPGYHDFHEASGADEDHEYDSDEDPDGSGPDSSTEQGKPDDDEDISDDREEA